LDVYVAKKFDRVSYDTISVNRIPDGQIGNVIVDQSVKDGVITLAPRKAEE